MNKKLRKPTWEQLLSARGMKSSDLFRSSDDMPIDYFFCCSISSYDGHGMTNENLLLEPSYEAHAINLLTEHQRADLAHRYVLRMPGKGTDKLCNWHREHEIIKVLKAHGFADEVVYFDPMHGIKISEFIEHSHTVDIEDKDDIVQAVSALKQMHNQCILVPHRFDPYALLKQYEQYCSHRFVHFKNYEDIREQVLQNRFELESLQDPYVLVHADFTPENVLLTPDKTHLIDWEYAGMYDRHVDIPMFILYAMADTTLLHTMLSIYVDREPTHRELKRAYLYMALGGLVWSAWCEYKLQLGENPGDDYVQFQFDCAKRYTELAHAL